eukprot:c21807_g2_i1.p1 GENE.c21807_g2_i1~~c21807_g2_i1.p1  ORF type:complete len:210 (-),score=62.10 c21807_g2_i1:115-744(-)
MDTQLISPNADPDDVVITIRIIVIGDPGIGKEQLLDSFVRLMADIPSLQQVPEGTHSNENIVFRTVPFYVEDEKGNTKHVKLEILNLDAFRSSHKEFYESANVCIVCFDVDNRETFSAVETGWALDTKFFCRTASVLLVGLKGFVEKSEENVQESVSEKEGIQMAQKTQSFHYLECQNEERLIKEVFVVSTKEGLRAPQKDSNEKCLLL